jgi:hypothetical protein
MWREITEDDVLGALNSTETTIYQSVLAGAGQDVLADIITRVVQQARNYIADNPVNRLGEGNTLPERAIRPALHLIRKDLLTRLDIEVSEDRRKDATEAIRFFERISDGKGVVELPDGATEPSGPVQTIDVVRSHEQHTNRDTLAGL